MIFSSHAPDVATHVPDDLFEAKARIFFARKILKSFAAATMFAGQSAEKFGFSHSSLKLKSLLPQPLQFVEQRAAADAERLGGFRAVKLMLL